MKLSIVYTPSLSSFTTAFKLMFSGLCLLVGMKVTIEQEMESSELTDAIIEDLKQQQKDGKLSMTIDQLRESLLVRLQ